MSELTFGEEIIKGLEEALEVSKGNKSVRRMKVDIVPVKDVTKYEIKSLREELNLSQNDFAAVIGVSKKAVESWETGTKRPNGAARRLIELISYDHSIISRFHKVS